MDNRRVTPCCLHCRFDCPSAFVCTLSTIGASRSTVEQLGRDARPHRGAAGTHPENTLASFAAALEQGAQILESDIHVSRDGVPVLLSHPEESREVELVVRNERGRETSATFNCTR